MMMHVSEFIQKAYIGVWFLAIYLSASGVSAIETSVSDTSLPSAEQVDRAQSQAIAEAGTDVLSKVPPLYEYQLTARPDPFKPFIAPKAVDANELVDVERELSGMQLFEPGQLTLVAVMDTPGGRVAMVEDVTKKGYLLREGILIGRFGKVTEIRRDQVVVTETAHTRGGEEIKTVVAMKLKRDGEGQ